MTEHIGELALGLLLAAVAWYLNRIDKRLEKGDAKFEMLFGEIRDEKHNRELCETKHHPEEFVHQPKESVASPS